MQESVRPRRAVVLSVMLVVSVLVMAAMAAANVRGPVASDQRLHLNPAVSGNGTGNTTGTSTSNNTTDCPANGEGNFPFAYPTEVYSVNWTISGDTVMYSVTTPGLNASSGVPGIQEYCVYPDGGNLSGVDSYSTSVNEGGSAWTAFIDCSKGNGPNYCVQSQRTGGDPNNIPDNGATVEALTVVFNTDPEYAPWTIVLHITDSGTCTALKGSATSGCYVIPAWVPSEASPLTVTVNATPAFNQTFSWSIDKSVSPAQIDVPSGDSATFDYNVTVSHDEGVDSAWTVAGTVTVTNPNTGDALVSGVTDSVNDASASCTVAGTWPATIPGSGSSEFGYSCSFAAAPLSSSEVDTATAIWSAQTVDGGTLAAGTASNTASIDWDATVPTVVDGSVTVSDTIAGDLGTVSYTDPSPTTFPYPWTYANDSGGTCTEHENSVSFLTNDTGTNGSANATVTVCVGADLTVSKTANPSFTRTYEWNITKSVDPSSQTILEGENATFGYTVAVEQTGFVDSGWAVNGNITVTNPNDWETIMTNVSDQIDNGGNCTVTGGTNLTIPAGSSVTVAYSCTYSSAPTSGNGTNTGTATWDGAAAYTPNGSASGQASFEFVNPTTVVDQTVTVQDVFNGGSPETLGTVNATDGPTFASAQFTYDRVLSGVSGACTAYTNNATLAETGQNDSATVTLCVVPPATVTNTAFCPIPGNQTNLIFISSSVGYQLKASNPGQFYENIFFVGTPGDTVEVTADIPYPFVTSGARPIQLSGTRTIDLSESPCLAPDFANNSLLGSISGTTASGAAITTTSPSGYLVVTLAAYDVASPMGSYSTLSITGTIPSSGLFYLTIHLDYGLKGTAGWSPTPAKCKTCDASGSSPAVTIHYGQEYDFPTTITDSNTSQSLVQSPSLSTVNTFKKDPGFAGVVTDASGNPISGVKVQVFDSGGRLLATVYTDHDGFYSYAYKWTGKAATFTIKLPTYGVSQQILLKSNALVIIDFTV